MQKGSLGQDGLEVSAIAPAYGTNSNYGSAGDGQE